MSGQTMERDTCYQANKDTISLTAHHHCNAATNRQTSAKTTPKLYPTQHGSEIPDPLGPSLQKKSPLQQQ
jgi:hypothetical protein